MEFKTTAELIHFLMIPFLVIAVGAYSLRKRVVDTKREEKMAELEGTEIRLRIREKRMVFLQELVEELIPKVIHKKMTNKEIVHLLYNRIFVQRVQ